jgi:two-component system sensor histidine kinase RegB
MHERLGLREAMEEAAAPLRGLGADIRIELEPPPDAPEPPVMRRRAELVYAMGNFIENAIDFARAQVTVTGAWDAETITVTIDDDGPGFPPEVLAKLGEPYISTRPASPGQGGLGLGVFIAQTLVERLGGSVRFENVGRGGGARVVITLPRKPLERSAGVGAA